MKAFTFRVVAALTIIFGCHALAVGQSDRGTIRGTVADPNGAVVAGAQVVATSAETGERRETTTSSEGIYVFPELSANTYNISVEAQGFQRTTIENFKVAVQVTHTLNIEVTVGAATVEITVDAEAEALQADTPVQQTNVTERQVRELPLLVTAESGGRSPLAFIFLDSNVTSSSAGTASTGTDASRFRVSGGQALGTEILIDGASTRRTQNGTFFSEVAPGPNAFQEFTISTSTYSAQFGNSSGGIVNFTLKSGTNDFHGEVYDLVRNEKFNANRIRNIVQGNPRDRDNQNNFGFNIGGPIVIPGFGEGTPIVNVLRNRAFFFFNYEGYRFTESETALVTVPTERMRRGDFSELLDDPEIRRIFPGDPANNIEPGVRIYNPNIPANLRIQPYVRNIIPASDFDLAGFRILQFFPLPNRSGVFRNYLASSTRPNKMNQFSIKTDFQLTEKQRLTVSYSQRKQERLQGFNGPDDIPRFPRFPLPFIGQDVWEQSFSSNFARIQHNYNITPTILNYLNIGYTFYDVANRNTTDPFDTSSLGIPLGSTQNTAFPRIGFPGYGEPDRSSDPRAYQSIGSSFFTDRIKDGSLDISDFVTFVVGRQTIRVGANFRIAQFNFRQRIDPGGSFNFRNEQTSSGVTVPVPGGDPRLIDPNSGWPIAGLITGATEFAFNFNNSIDPAFRQLTQSYFIQDDIKLTSKLTLNVGLRYDLSGLRTEANDRYRTFDPDAINPVVNRRGAIVGAGGQSGLQAEFKTLSPNDKSNFGPRLGAAYAFDNKTVIRGGIGLYYSPVIYGIDGGNELNTGLLGYNTPASYPCNLNGNDCRNSLNFLSRFPRIPPADANNQLTGRVNPVNNNFDLFDVQYFGENFKNGRTIQYSVDVQRELPYNFVALLGYTGHRGYNLRSNFNRLNALPLDALRLGFDILRTNINAVDADQRAYAASVGINIPANGNAVYEGFNGTVAQALRPFPQYRNINSILESEGSSTYNAFQAKLERRFSNGIQAGFAYTFSRLITDASEDLFGGGPQNGILQNPFDRSSLRTVSPNNPPHVFVANFLAELPFGKGRRFLNQGGITNVLFGGFQVAGIFRYQSGLPIVVFSPNNTEFLGLAGYLGNLRLNLTGQPIALAETTRRPRGNAPDGIQVLNPAAFAQPTNFGSQPFRFQNGQLNPDYRAFYSNPLNFFGTSPTVITDFRTDPFFSEDISILKKTRITERFTLELGAEFFNVFNRVRYGPPNTDYRSNEFGVKGIIERPRVIQLRGRFIF